jgi:hypothetical protein
VSVVKEWGEGGQKFIPMYEDFHYALHAFFGKVPTTAGAGPYTHTFPPTAGLSSRVGQSWTAEQQVDDTRAKTFRGWKCNALKISGSLEQAVMGEFGAVAMAEQTDQTPAASPAYATLSPIIPSQITLSFDGTALEAYEFELDLGWEVGRPHIFGTKFFGREPHDSGVLNVGLRLAMYMDDYVQYAKYLADTDIDVAIVCSAGASQSLTINLNKARIADFVESVDGREEPRGNIELVPTFDTIATENCQIVVVNSVANATF